MTDFVRDLLREEEPEQVPPVAAQAMEAAQAVRGVQAAVPVTDRRRVTAARLAAAAARAAAGREEEESAPNAQGAQGALDVVAVPGERADAGGMPRQGLDPGVPVAGGRAAGAPGRDQSAQQAPGHAQAVGNALRREHGSGGPSGHERPAAPPPQPDPGPDRRAGLLAATVTALARAPERADVDALLVGYADAPALEVEQAARTVTAVFLRAPAGLRPPLRAVLAPAVQRHRGTPLADRLAARLAGGAMPPTAAASGPSGAPGEDGRGTGTVR